VRGDASLLANFGEQLRQRVEFIAENGGGAGVRLKNRPINEPTLGLH
jgi:hypothetical protein